MRLDDALADGEPKNAGGGPCARGRAGVLAEQVRQFLRGNAAALVGDRQLDVATVERGGHPDRRRRRVAGGVGEQVAEHPDDAGAVGHHARQLRRQVDGHVLAGAAGQQLAARRGDERARVGRLGAPGAEHCGGGALDGGERHAQLVAHHAEEVGAHAVELLERGEVL